jgi:uncharacterized FlaG/YvyC family protein
MSSNLVLEAISVVQPTAQDAVGNKNPAAANVTKLFPISQKGLGEFSSGTNLPNTGNVVPSNAADNGNQALDNIESQSNSDAVSNAVQNLNDYIQNNRRELNFSIDEQTGRTVVKVIDNNTKEVIRQIPAEEVLALARRVAEEMDGKGNLFKGKV